MAEPLDPRRPDRRALRFLALWVGTTTVFYPLGAASTIFAFPGDVVGIFMVLFLIAFLSITILEPSVAVNVALPLAFWCPAFAIMAFDAGVAAGGTRRLIQGALLLSFIALVHVSVQGSLALMCSIIRRQDRRCTPSLTETGTRSRRGCWSEFGMPLSKKAISAVLGLTVILVIAVFLVLLLIHPVPDPEDLIGRWKLAGTPPNGDNHLRNIEFFWEDKAKGEICLVVLYEVLGTYFYGIEGSNLVPISIGGTSKGAPCRFRFDNGNALVLMFGNEALHYRRVLSKPDRETQDDLEQSSPR